MRGGEHKATLIWIGHQGEHGNHPVQECQNLEDALETVKRILRVISLAVYGRIPINVHAMRHGHASTYLPQSCQ